MGDKIRRSLPSTVRARFWNQYSGRNAKVMGRESEARNQSVVKDVGGHWSEIFVMILPVAFEGKDEYPTDAVISLSVKCELILYSQDGFLQASAFYLVVIPF